MPTAARAAGIGPWSDARAWSVAYRGRVTDVWTWMRERRTPVDAALATGLWLVLAWLPTGAVFFGRLFAESTVRRQLVTGLLMAAPVVLRRSRPALGLAASCTAGLVQLAVVDTIQPIDVCFLFAVHGVAAYDSRGRTRYAALVVGWLAAAACALRWSSTGPSAVGRYLPGTLVLLVLAVTATWTGGALLRTRRAATDQALERARRAEVDAEQQQRLAAARERAQIARELHDIVAHSLAVMIVQADGGRYVAASDPVRAAAALETIAVTGRDALSQMRHLLGVLRDEPGSHAALGSSAGGPTTGRADGALPGGAHPGGADPGGGRPDGAESRRRGTPVAPTTPQPVLADLPALVDGVRRAGVQVSERLPDPLPPVTPQVAAVVYRIVQESLTNVLKHAGPAARVEVALHCTGGSLVVQVDDDGPPAGTRARVSTAAEDGAGRGLLGMRERAALVAGRVSAGPALGGGWRVRAVLPLRAPTVVAPVAPVQQPAAPAPVRSTVRPPAPSTSRPPHDELTARLLAPSPGRAPRNEPTTRLAAPTSAGSAR